MLLAGMALPPIQLGGMGLVALVAHVILITIVSNIGKCLPLTAYTSEASVRERLALSIGMFPRGEVGIGVLLVSAGNFSSAEHARFSRSTTKYDGRRAQFGA